MKFLFLFFLFNFLSVNETIHAEEIYRFHDSVIPFGDGINSIPSVLEKVGGSLAGGEINHSEEGATDYYDVDSKKVYLFYQYPNGTSEIRGLKVFDLTGDEVASWKSNLNKYKVFRKIKVSGEKVYVVDDLDDTVLEFDKNLKFIKDVKIPKDFNPPFGLTYSTVGFGVVQDVFGKDLNKDEYVFDRDDWLNNGKPQFLESNKSIKLKLGWVSGHVTSRKLSIGVNQDLGDFPNRKFEVEEDVKFSGSVTDDDVRTDHTRVVGFDDKQNMYLQVVVQDSRLVKEDFLEELIKLSPSGEVLKRFEDPWPSWGVFSYKVDKQGNVYLCEERKDGFHIAVWENSEK